MLRVLREAQAETVQTRSPDAALALPCRAAGRPGPHDVDEHDREAAAHLGTRRKRVVTMSDDGDRRVP